MMNQQEIQFLLRALRTEHSERSISMLRAIKSGSDKYEAMLINKSVLECFEEQIQLAVDSLAPLVVGVKHPEVLRDLVSVWSPESTGIRGVYQDVRGVVDSAGWDADHSDNVNEDIRRVNYAKREKFTEAAMAIIAVKFANVFWGRSSLSSTLVNALFENGVLDFVVSGNSYEAMPDKMVSSLFVMIDRWGDGHKPSLGDEAGGAVTALAAHMEESQFSKIQVSNCIIGGDEINAMPKASVEWLVDGMIPKTVEADNPFIGFLYGNSGTYKSFIATGICSALVKGNRNAAGFAGLAGVSGEPMNILYLSGEDSYGIRERLEAELGEQLPSNVKMNLVELDTIYDSTGSFDPAIARAVIDHAPDLIVLDTMNSLKLCENNNSSAAVSKMMHKVKELGTTVMIVHHSTKGGDSMEGSHAMFSNADFVLRTDVVEREDDIPVVDLSCGKLKNAAKFKTMRIELVDQGESLVCRNHKAYEESREDEAKALGLDPTMLRLIVESDEKGITVPQLANHKDVNWKHSRQHLIGTLDKNIDDMVEGWADVVKVSSPGVATRYILGAKYKAKL